MNIHIELNDPQRYAGCLLLDTLPECTMGYKS